MGAAGRGRAVIARVVEAAEYAALMPAGLGAALGWMWFWMVAAPDLAAAARLAFRAVRVLFLGVGWAVAVARLLL